MLNEAIGLYIACSMWPPFSINLEVKICRALYSALGQRSICFHLDNSAHPAMRGSWRIVIDN